MLKRAPFYVLLFAIHPSLALLSGNIREVEASVIVRPALASLLLALVVFAGFRLLLRDTDKAALATTLLSILFYSYGHLYQLLRSTAGLGAALGRHRYLAPLYLIVLVVGLWLITRRLTSALNWTPALNLAGLVLLAFPIVQIVQFEARLTRGTQAAVDLASSAQALTAKPNAALPDVYYIILDTYARHDVIQRELRLDNTPFLLDLQQMGFVVAQCSRSNYGSTDPSLVSSLNLAYLPEVQSMLIARGADEHDTWVLIKHSIVRDSLAALGYKTVAFDTTYEWTRLTDADYYLGPGRDRLDLQSLGQFEVLYAKSTALLIVMDARQKYFEPRAEVASHPYQGHIRTQQLILEELPHVAALPEPTFTFAHILIPHVPFTFDAEGGLRTDPGFYGGGMAGPVNDEYFRQGYVGEVLFVNRELVRLLTVILAESATPPIIVIQGDHGFWGAGNDSGRLSILNAYYLPDGGNDSIYADISPVNTFRLIFDLYFGTSYGLLEDRNYLDLQSDPVPEASAPCLPDAGSANPP
jgi:hypothetical protein